MQVIFLWFLSFFLVFFFYFFFVLLSKKGRAKLKNGVEAKFLKKVSEVNLDSISDLKFSILVSFLNSFIVATTFCLVNFIKNFLLQIVFAFILLVLLIIIVYKGVGTWLKKK